MFNHANGVKNLARAANDALLAKVNAPAPVLPRSNPLDGHDVAIHVDGKRISLTYIDITLVGEREISILAETALDAALDPAVDATMAMAWGGFKPHQSVQYRVGPDEPSGGVFQISSVKLPTVPDGPAFFVGTALTALFDWSDEGRQIAVAGDECQILTTHVAVQV
jgi:hypothetical protein